MTPLVNGEHDPTLVENGDVTSSPPQKPWHRPTCCANHKSETLSQDVAQQLDVVFTRLRFQTGSLMLSLQGNRKPG